LEELALARRQSFDVGHQVAVVVEVEEDFAAVAEVLDLALAPAHHKSSRAETLLRIRH
jgi:hypothetical protein